MVFDAARGRVEDLDDDDSDENPSTPREPVRPATPKRSGGSGRKKKERSLPPRKLGALTALERVRVQVGDRTERDDDDEVRGPPCCPRVLPRPVHCRV